MPRPSRRAHGPDRFHGTFSFEEVTSHRHLACGLYNLCLELVVRRGWGNFSCQGCSLMQGTWARAATNPTGATILPLRAAGQRS
ncbi:MAG: hypothetical protein KQJ78_11900 [Deltaproteobacteria bacterium]|nr:hypothetical protein [Deltaproteobacteria bacterium]